jgi:hypothetical protein
LRRSRARIARSLRWHLAPSQARGWSPKFLTLTLPHSGDVRRDVAALTAAWRRFWRLVEDHLRLDRGIKRRVQWFRVLEITPSGGGHAHLHAVLIMPFVHQALLAHLWGRALPAAYSERIPVERVADTLSKLEHEWQREQLATYLVSRRGRNGRRLDARYAPVVDIREFREKDTSCVAESIAAEAAKYMIKDAEHDKNGNLIWNSIASARAYEAAEGHRTIAASRGFWRDAAPPPCGDCGASSACRHVEVVRLDRAKTYGCAAIPRGP